MVICPGFGALLVKHEHLQKKKKKEEARKNLLVKWYPLRGNNIINGSDISKGF